MIRQWQVPPDMQTQDGQPVVSLHALQEALLEGATLVHRAGGNLSLIVGRQPTQIPHEMVTTGAIVTWQDRTDAKAQPEAQRALGVEPEVFPSTWSDEEPADGVEETLTAEAVESQTVGEDDELEATEARIQELREQGKTDEEITAELVRG